MPFPTRPRPADILDGTIHYLVDTPEGSVGVVDGWERDEHDRPQALIVAQGWFGRRRFVVPLEALLEIDHADRRIILARGAAPLESKGPMQRLLEIGQDRSAEEAADPLPRRGVQPLPVLCGVADDGRARAIVAVATRLARKLAAPLVVVHVTPSSVPPGISAAPGDTLIDISTTAVKRVVARGTPAETLAKLAVTECAQLLVIGATDKRSLGALRRGSVSQHVISHVRCPVVVVPSDLTRLDDERDDRPSDTSDYPTSASAAEPVALAPGFLTGLIVAPVSEAYGSTRRG